MPCSSVHRYRHIVRPSCLHPVHAWCQLPGYCNLDIHKDNIIHIQTVYGVTWKPVSAVLYTNMNKIIMTRYSTIDTKQWIFTCRDWFGVRDSHYDIQHACYFHQMEQGLERACPRACRHILYIALWLDFLYHCHLMQSECF